MATATDYLEKAKSIRSTNIFDKSKGTLTSSAIGAGVGILVGYSRGYNILFSAFIGGALGGLTSYFLTKNDK
jgi:hypothetical protein